MGPAAPYLSIFIIVLLLLLYGYEIFNFTLSIDEEIVNSPYIQRAPLQAVKEGRATMALLAAVFPVLGSVPVLSTALFCTCLGVSAYVLTRVLFRQPSAQWAFAGFFVSFPLWPHIVEFSTISWGIGIGVALMSLAFVFTLADLRWSAIRGVVVVSLATGIYQNLYALFLIFVIILYLSVSLRLAPDSVTESYQRNSCLRRSGLIAAGGLVGYIVLQRLVLTVFSVQLAYVQRHVRLGEFIRAPKQAISTTLRSSWNLLTGTDPLYLGYGRALMLLPLIGLLMVVVRLLRPGPLKPLQRLLGFGGLVAVLMIGLGPLVIGAGDVTARALFAWVPVAAFLAGVSLSNARFERPLLAVLIAVLFISSWVTLSLFYTDHLARQRDQLLAARIMSRVDRILETQPRDGPIPFVVVGPVRPKEPPYYGFQKLQVFGNSFFEHDGGNAYRVSAYLKILGVENMVPRRLADIASYRPVIDAMPVWPAAGSVAMVNGVLVIKLGPLRPV
jgi:hypothetical protein